MNGRLSHEAKLKKSTMKRAVMRYLELLEKFPVLVESEAGQNARNK